MITDDNMKQAVYEHILKAANKRLEQGVPGSEGAFAQLSLAQLLNVLFLLKGEWPTIGDYVTTQKAVRALVGEQLLWAEPQKSSLAPIELLQ
jgi:hypothetical protein